MIAVATIGLCFCTQLVAGWLGITLPDQQNVTLVRNSLGHAFDAGWRFYASRYFWGAAFLVAQVVAIMPAIEELIFRGLLFKAVARFFERRARRSRPTIFTILPLTLSSLLFSAAHYIAQPWPDAAFIALFFFGAAQCWLYYRTQRIWCAMLNHALFNLTNLALLFVVPESAI